MDPPPGAPLGHHYRSVSYYVNWAIYARDHQPQALPVSNLTHCLYAFANIKPDGEVHLTDSWSDVEKHYPSDSWNDVGTNVYGCFKQLYLHKKRNRHFKLLLSIGGWTYSSNFAAPCSTPAGRERFASSALTLLKDLGLDGLDIDWEYPSSAAEAAHYTQLLATVRHALDTYSATLPSRPHFLLTVASPAGPVNFQRMDIRGMDPYLDFWNLMAYDFAGSWDPRAGHQANIFPSTSHPDATPFSAHAAIAYYRDCGVAPHKIVLGMPLYGRAFCNTDGPGQPFSGVGEGSWENGVFDYKALPLKGARVHHDPQALASWSYDAASRTLVTYDDAPNAAAKVAYVQRERLGGVMWWESSGDRPGDGGGGVGGESLINLVAQGLGGYSGKHLDRTPNVLDYPESKYDNLRKGMPGE